MPDRPGKFLELTRTHVAAMAVAIWMLTICGAARPQAAPPSAPAAADPPAPQSGEPAAPPAERPDNPGLLNEIGKMLQKPWSTLKSPSETIDDLNARAKDAGATLSRITRPSSMVTGRMICPVSANGAPDCKAASDRLCQSKGFKEGKSLTIDSVESCSAKILVPGRTRKPDDCRTDNFVTHALCQ
jgi:hypothetical protein